MPVAKPRAAWTTEQLDGYVIKRLVNGWWNGEFYWSDSLNEANKDRQDEILVFADRATYLKAERLTGTPVFVSAIEVKRGGQSLYLVESITEPH